MSDDKTVDRTPALSQGASDYRAAPNLGDEEGASPDPIAFPLLTPSEIEALRAYGEETVLQDEQPLWEPGDVDYCFYVILSGGCVVASSADRQNQVAYHRPGEFTGDVDNLTARPAPVGGYADGETHALVLSADQIRAVVRMTQDLGGKILLAFIRRREILLQSGDYGTLIVGSQYDPETIALRQFLGRNRVVHRWRRPEDPDTAQILQAFHLKAADTPIVFLGQERLVRPSIEALADRLGSRRHTRSQYDLVIAGAGPAGLAAAVYGASEGLSTLLLDRSAPGGQASWSSRIENYMGFPEGLTGADLAARGLMQAQKFGAELSVPCEVAGIESEGAGYLIHLSSGDTVGARAVLIATGAQYEKLSVPGFARFETTGIYYAATRLEADFCSESEVVVVGAGNSAGQAAVFLAQQCKKVRLVVRGDDLAKSMSDYLSCRVQQIKNIDVLLETEIACLDGDDLLREAVLKGATDATVPCEGLFVFIGASPNTQFLKDTLALDKKGFILTGDSVRASWREARPPYHLETSRPGVFAAGDCRQGSVKRVASSVGEGSMAVTFVHAALAL